jgi:tetratricopeptide (TPR) repeat protein
LEEFKKDYFNKKLLEKFVGREEPENIKEAIEHYKTLLSIENNNSNNYATKGFIYYILKLEEKVGIKKLDENYIMKVKSGLGIQNDDLDKDSTWQNFVKLLVLKDIADEKLPSRVEVTNDIPFNLQKGEKIIWLTNLVELYEETISKSYEGGSVGMSFRVAPGTYLRASEYKGQPIETVNNKFITKGIIGYTQKHLYFFSFKKSFKIRYDKIVSLVPRSNGIIIMTEGVSKKPITFKNEDGVFIYNLITSLTRCEIELK